MAKDSGGGAAPRRPSGPKSLRERQRARAEHAGEIARRRTTALAAAGLVGALVLVGFFAIFIFNDDDSEPGSQTAPAARSPSRKVVNPRAGIEIIRPRGWRATTRGRVLVLRSPQGGTQLVVAAPPDKSSPQGVLDEATEDIRRQFRGIKFRPAPTGKAVAGRPARLALFSGNTTRDVKVDGLLAAVKGRRQVYAVQIVSSSRDPQIIGAQGALDTLQLTK